MGTRKLEEDVLSYCGSISGETFSSRRSKNTCNLRQHSIDVIAKRLRDYSFDASSQTQVTLDQQLQIAAKQGQRSHLNAVFHGFRFLVVMFGGFSLGMMLLLRYNVTLAILKMVNQTALYMHENPDKGMEDFLAEGYTVGGEFDWDNEIQHMIMSWYMIAYTLPQVPATKVGLIIGNRWAIFVSLLICALSTLLTPIMAYWGWQWVIALRLVNGIGASAVLPMMLNLIENWMPYHEMSLGLTCAQLLQAILTAANPLVIGWLSSLHWSYAFYGPAMVTLAFCALWLLVISDRPDENWLISKRELDYICGCPGSEPAAQADPRACEPKPKVAAIGNSNKLNTSPSISHSDEPKPTALDVFRVPSFYAFLFMWCFYCSSFSGFTFILPAYLRQFLKIEVSQNGFYCFIIQSGSLLAVSWPHPFLRLLESRFRFSSTVARRITHCFICSMVAFTWIYIGAFHDTQLPLLFINRCFQGSNDIVVTGTLMTNYAAAGLSSLVFSMVNTVGNLSVVFSSTFMGWLLDFTGQSREGWSCIYIGLGVSQLIMFLTFTTMIRTGPIDFAKMRHKNRNKQDLELAGKKTSIATTNDETPCAQIEVIAKKETPVQLLNNFDKFRDTKQADSLKV